MNEERGKKRRGTGLGFKIFDIYLSLGIKHAYALLYFVALHYLFFDKKAVRVSTEYVNARFNNPGYLARLKHIYRIFLKTGKNLIDLRLLERDFEKVHLEPDNRRIRELVAEGNGLLLFTAHIGNWQVMMRKLPPLGAKVNIVMLPEENPAVQEFLKIDHSKSSENNSSREGFTPRDEINIIDPSRGADAVLEIVHELASGNIVSIMADTHVKGSPTLTPSFFNDTITLPEGPFRIASAAKSPVICLLTACKAPCRYVMKSTELTIADQKLKRRDYIELLAQKYADTLENFLAEFPYEWSPAGKL